MSDLVHATCIVCGADDRIERIKVGGEWYERERTCTPHGEWKPVTQTQEVRRMFCDCGHWLGTDERGSMPFNYTYLFSMPRYCPECGCKLVSRGKVVDE